MNAIEQHVNIRNMKSTKETLSFKVKNMNNVNLVSSFDTADTE